RDRRRDLRQQLLRVSRGRRRRLARSPSRLAKLVRGKCDRHARAWGNGPVVFDRDPAAYPQEPNPDGDQERRWAVSLQAAPRDRRLHGGKGRPGPAQPARRAARLPRRRPAAAGDPAQAARHPAKPAGRTRGAGALVPALSVPAKDSRGPARPLPQSRAGGRPVIQEAGIRAAPERETATVAVVVVSFNVRELLRACLQSVLAAGGIRTELVVVDNASSDRSGDMVAAEFPGVRLVRNPDNRGFSRASNQGILATSAPYVLSLNPDAVVQPDAIATLADYLRDHPD